MNFLGILVTVLMLSACGAPYNAERMHDAVLAAPGYMKHSQNQATVNSGAPRTAYVATGEKTSPIVVFVHGSPGSWEAWGDYLADPQLLANARLVAVDRLGFGGSQPGVAEGSLDVQASAIVNALVDGKLLATAASDAPSQQAIWVGHSYGGPVIAQIAIEYPQYVSGLLFLAASVDPALEEWRWYNRLAHTWLGQALVPEVLTTANDEIWPLHDELVIQARRFGEINAPVVVIQGDEDSLVEPANADYIEHKLKSKTALDVIRLPDQGHLLPWERFALIREVLLRRLEMLQ